MPSKLSSSSSSNSAPRSDRGNAATSAATIMLPFEPGKPATTRPQQHRRKKKKKTLSKRRSASHDPLFAESFITKRRPLRHGSVPANIRIRETIMPKELEATSGGMEERGTERGMEVGVEGQEGTNDDDDELAIGTGLSSLTAPTVTVAPDDALANPAIDDEAGDDEDGGDRSSGILLRDGDGNGVESRPRMNEKKAAATKEAEGTKSAIMASEAKGSNAIIAKLNNGRSITDKKKKSKEASSVGTALTVGAGWKSTKKRLTYGLVEKEEDTSNAAAKSTKGKSAKDKDDVGRMEQNERSKKRRRSSAATAKVEAASNEDVRGGKKTKGQVVKDRDTSIAEKRKDKSKSSSASNATTLIKSNDFSQGHDAFTSSKRTSSNNTKTNSTTTSKPLSQSALLTLAKTHQTTIIQYHATYHRGDSILDKNTYFGTRNTGTGSDKYFIEDGDLVVRQDCANYPNKDKPKKDGSKDKKGTYWTTKFGFRHWMLPGQRKVRSNRGEKDGKKAMYVSTRPMLAEEAAVAEEDGGVPRRPLLTMDTTLSARDAEMVRRFVKDAEAGQTPFDFFSEDELNGGKSRQQQQNRVDDVVDGDDGLAFEDGSAPDDASDAIDRIMKERKALGDRSNTTANNGVSHHAEDMKASSKRGISKTLLEKPRTKSARRKNKRKSFSAPATIVESSTLLSPEETSGSNKRQRTMSKHNCIQFYVPTSGGYHEQQRHFGLIEGVGGGEEEIERGSVLPHRGRLMELPGSVLPGKWEALVLDDNEDNASNESKDGSVPPRISLRHDSAPSSASPLERYYSGKEATPDGLFVCMIDPLINRIPSFVKQGIFTHDEIDQVIANDDGEESMSNNSSLKIGCLTFATFDGFDSASESTNAAEETSKAMLSRCVRPKHHPANSYCQELLLHEIVGGNENNESDVTGMLFPCNLSFDCEYWLLMLHDGEFRVNAIDVIFRKPNTRHTGATWHFGITKSALSEHQKNVGVNVGECMKRFFEQELKRSRSALVSGDSTGKSGDASCSPGRLQPPKLGKDDDEKSENERQSDAGQVQVATNDFVSEVPDNEDEKVDRQGDNQSSRLANDSRKIENESSSRVEVEMNVATSNVSQLKSKEVSRPILQMPSQRDKAEAAAYEPNPVGETVPGGKESKALEGTASSANIPFNAANKDLVSVAKDQDYESKEEAKDHENETIEAKNDPGSQAVTEPSASTAVTEPSASTGQDGNIMDGSYRANEDFHLQKDLSTTGDLLQCSGSNGTVASGAFLDPGCVQDCASVVGPHSYRAEQERVLRDETSMGDQVAKEDHCDDDGKTLIAAYEDFEKGSRFASITVTSKSDPDLSDRPAASVDGNATTKTDCTNNMSKPASVDTISHENTKKDGEVKLGKEHPTVNIAESANKEMDGVKSATKKDIGISSGNTHPSVNRRSRAVVREDTESLHPKKDARGRLRGASITSRRKATIKPSIRRKLRFSLKDQAAAHSETDGEVSSTDSNPGWGEPSLSMKRSSLKSTTRTSESKSAQSTTAKKRSAASINLVSSLNKPKKVVVLDLFDDTESLFGCEILSYAKTPSNRKDNARLLRTFSAKKSGQKHSEQIVHLGSSEKQNEVTKHDRSIQQRHIKQTPVQSHRAKEKLARKSYAVESRTKPLDLRIDVETQTIEPEKRGPQRATPVNITTRKQSESPTPAKITHSTVPTFIAAENELGADEASKCSTIPTPSNNVNPRQDHQIADTEVVNDEVHDIQGDSVETPNIQRVQSAAESPCSFKSCIEAYGDDHGIQIVSEVNVIQPPIHNQDNSVENTPDDESSHPAIEASCSFGNCSDVHGDNGSILSIDDFSDSQPLYDVYFGRERGRAAIQPVQSILDPSEDQSQPFHDCFYGQESGIENDINSEDGSTCQPVYGVYFGLDDGDLSVGSQLDLSSSTTMDQDIPLHDCYFGKESYLEEEGHSSRSNEILKVATRISRRTVQSKPLLVMTLLAWMLQRAL